MLRTQISSILGTRSLNNTPYLACYGLGSGQMLETQAIQFRARTYSLTIVICGFIVPCVYAVIRYNSKPEGEGRASFAYCGSTLTTHCGDCHSVVVP